MNQTDETLCNLCDNPGPHKILLTNAKDTPYRLVECSTCGLRFLEPQPAPADRMTWIQRQHDVISALTMLQDHRSAHHRAFAAAQLDRIKQFTSWQTSRQLLVYEVGAAIGWLLGEMMNLGINPDSEGCEPNAVLAGAGGAAYGLGLEAEVFQRASCSREPYDVVLMNDVLEHSLTPSGDLFKARKICMSGACLYLKTFLDELDKPNDRRMLDPPDHLFHFTRPTLREMIEQVGWSIQVWEEDPEWAHVTIFALAED